MGRRTPADAAGRKEEFQRLSLFRYGLRRFLRFSEDTCRAHGVSMLQYQLLLHTQAFGGRDWASIGELAERLQSQPHGVVALVDRCEAAGLVERRPNALDGRLVEVHLTAAGRRLLHKVADKHREELRKLTAALDQVQEAGKPPDGLSFG